MDLKNVHRIVLEKAIISISLMVFSVGVLVAYTFVSMIADPAIYIDVDFMNPIDALSTITIIAIISLVVYNANVNYRFRNHFTKVVDNKADILYLMCLPMLVIVLIMTALIAIRSLSNVHCIGIGSCIFYVSTGVFFVFVLFLLLESNGRADQGEEWIINFSNYSVILITIASLLGYSIQNIGIEQISMFTSQINITIVNDTCQKNGSSFVLRLNDTWNDLEFFMRKITVAFCIISSVLLIRPLQRHYNHMLQHRLNVGFTDGAISSVSHPGIDFVSLILCLLFGIALLLSSVSILIDHSSVFQFIYQSLTIIAYILLISFETVLLSSVKSWESLTEKHRTFNEIIVGLGLFGMLFHCLAMIVTSIYQLCQDYNVLFVLTLIKYLLAAFQIVFQNVLEQILLSKKWKHQDLVNLSSVRFLFFFFAMYNGILMVADMTHSSIPFLSPRSNEFFLMFFVNGFDDLGMIFGLFFRLHGFVLFLYLFIKIIKENKFFHIVVPEMSD